MRLTDKVIRDELRQEASSVPIPTDMWAQINRQLEVSQRAAARQPVSRFPLRHTLVAGLAMGIFWFSLIPASSYVDRSAQQPAVEAPAARRPERRSTADPALDPNGEWWKMGHARTVQASGSPDVGRTGPAIAMY